MGDKFNTLDQPFYSDFGVELTHSRVAGKRRFRKFGRNPDLDSGSGFEALWNGGGLYTGFDATAEETVELFSSSANDASAGTGARTVELSEGLDGDFNPVATEIVTLNGITPVTTVNQYMRLPRMRVLTAGSTGSNEGTITARQQTTTANVFAVMPIGFNSTMIGAYTVSSTENGAVRDVYISMGGNTNAIVTFQFWAREEGSVFQVLGDLQLKGAGTSYIRREFPLPSSLFLPKTDIVIMASSGSNNTVATGEFDMILSEL